ncbi:hypothetical protein [uncultured Nitrosomonas sp.]|uniref:hypothetical protein n=1 Tax=uncultured Nitrosomonas sp. TaxID=156424 RepID=UPI0026040FC1|nr:hypothetical protein [uncultured Nitrosomonas sp.]
MSNVRLSDMPIVFLFVTVLFAAALFFGVALGLSFDSGWKLSIGETTSLFVAILAMAATNYQAWLTRRHNRLQVQPLIMLEYPMEAKPTIDGSHQIGCRLHNIGLGPADVSNVRFMLNGKRVNAQELMDALWKDTGIDSLYQQRKINCEPFAADLANSIYIKEDQTFLLVNIKFWPEKTEKRASFAELSSAHNLAIKLIRKHLRIQAEYSSIYKEEPKKIDSHDYKKESHA